MPEPLDESFAAPSPQAAAPLMTARRWARVTALVEVVAASGLPTQFALGGLLLACGVAPLRSDGRLAMPFVASVLGADTVLLLAFVAWRLRAGGDRVAAILAGPRPWRRDVWLGLALVPAIFGAVAGLLVLLRAVSPWLHNVDTNPFESLIQSTTDAIVLTVLVVVSGGLKEEVQRAFVLRRFEQHLGGARLGLPIYSVVFGLGHFIQGYDVGLMTTLMGVGWGALFLWRRNIIAASVSHAGFNAAQILQFLVSGS
ncbi:MAG: CPBP family intramembrane metalloprotease [Acidobacteria bacterium]|nr:CPBP family intramembrane metalloprotease [Acidobacteriota bacterium]